MVRFRLTMLLYLSASDNELYVSQPFIILMYVLQSTEDGLM